MGWTARGWAAALALAGAAGCGDSPPLEPHTRFADALAAAREWREPPTATIGARTHYVMNDVAPRPLRDRSQPQTVTSGTVDAEGQLVVDGRCPPEWAARLMLVDALLVRKPPSGSEGDPAADRSIARHREVVRCVDGDGATSVIVDGLEPDGEYGIVELVGMVLPPTATESPWVVLPPGAVLRTALGVRRGGAVAEQATPFRVRAENADGGSVAVAEWTVRTTEDDRQGRWVDVEASLAAARSRLGDRVRFVFETTPWHGPAGMAIPVWGNPTVFAPSARAADAPRPRNVVLVSLDTLRADRLGAYGYPLPITPSLDAFAAAGTLLERTTAPASWTIPSHASMLTGLQPCVHEMRKWGRGGGARPFAPEIVPLAELLRRQGYRTAAFTENAFVDRVPFQRGFDRFDADRGLDAIATPGHVDVTFANALAWVREHGAAPFFLFVHTYQVHEPYTPLAEDLAAIPSPLPLAPGGVPPAPKHEADAAAYVAEVAYTDRAVGRFLEELDSLTAPQETIVVVTSDHGEAFGEHGTVRHGNGIHEEELWVPLLWRAPGLVEAGRRVAGLATLADIPPTILALLGQPIAAGTQGLDLSPFLTPGGAATITPRRVLQIEGLRARGMHGETWKLLRVAPYGSLERRLVLLSRDPGERNPIAAKRDFVEGWDRHHQRECDAARRRLAAAAPAPAIAPPAPRDPEQERKLRALGYVE